MFSDCEDDLCIFVCGTCKRYFTKLSDFSQHKKEKSCIKKTSTLMQTEIAQEINENGQFEISNYNGTEILNDSEDNSQRKYPRKQDKKLIKRTIRELQDEKLLSPEGKVNVESLFISPAHNHRPSQDFITTELQRTCKHPVYTCKTCHAEFPNTNGRVFKCVDCRRGFYTEADLNQHMLRAKHNNLCAVCGKIFPDKYKLRKHELSHVTEKNFRCEEPGCTKSFKSAEDVRTHVRYVHAVEKRYHCTHCSRAFTRLDKFKLHMNTHGIVMKPGPISPTSDVLKPPTSNFLALKPPSKQGSKVTEVVETADIESTDASSHCSRLHDPSTTATDVADPSDHVKDVSVVSLDNSVDSRDSVLENLTNAENGELLNSSLVLPTESTYKCEKCHTSYQNSVEFLAHEERRADHVLRCDQCSGKFLSFCELRSHIRAEHGDESILRVQSKPAQPPGKKEKKHFCEECGKGFTRADKLKRHSIIHSPNRPCIPCICKDSHGCDRTFYRNDSMKRHALTHSEDKPYTCEDCGKSFSRPGYLTKHIGQTHKREFKYLCTLCDYGAREIKRLKIHIRTKHELDPDLLLATEASESNLVPSMAHTREAGPHMSAGSPSTTQSSTEMNLSSQDSNPHAHDSVPQDNEDMTLAQEETTSSHVVQEEMTSPHQDVHVGMEYISCNEESFGINGGGYNSKAEEIAANGIDEVVPHNSDIESRILVQHTGEIDDGHLVSTAGQLAQGIEATTAVIEPLTNDLSPTQLTSAHNLDRHTQNMSPCHGEFHHNASDVNLEDRYDHSTNDISRSVESPRKSESSPVTRQSVISQELTEFRMLPDIQHAVRHTFNNDRRSSDVFGEQSVRSRFPYGFTPQQFRPQYSMATDFTTMSHHPTSTLSQFPQHQSLFSNMHMQFQGGSENLSEYERKTPLNSRPLSSQTPYWRT